MLKAEKKILLVDDERTNVIMLGAMLRQAGLPSEGYSDPEKALVALQSHPEEYSIVLADRMMPRLTALQLLQVLSLSPETQRIPFIVITGLAESDEQIDLLKAGVFDILIKPIDREVLMGVVRRAYQLIASGAKL